MKAAIHIVSTKTLSNELAQRIESVGMSLQHADFIKKKIRIPETLNAHGIHPTIVLTSKTAVQAWLEIVNQLKLNKNKYRIYCLAKATHELAVQHDLQIAGIARDSTALADEILKDKEASVVTWVRGNLRRYELPDKLRLHGVTVHEIVAYHTGFSAVKVDSEYHGVIFFSPSAVDSFLSLNSVLDSVAFCIGKTTANHATKSGFREVLTADQHTPEALVKTIINYYKNENIHAQK